MVGMGGGVRLWGQSVTDWKEIEEGERLGECTVYCCTVGGSRLQGVLCSM